MAMEELAAVPTKACAKTGAPHRVGTACSRTNLRPCWRLAKGNRLPSVGSGARRGLQPTG